MSRITLDQANAVIAGAFDKAREMALKPVAEGQADAVAWLRARCVALHGICG
mgnify:CR=1 FL=1